MKLTTLAFSLSSVAISTAAGINIGDNQSISVPPGQNYGANGIQNNAGVENPATGVASDGEIKEQPESSSNGGIVIGDNQSISVPSGLYYGANGIQTSNSLQNGATETIDSGNTMEVSGNQEVALIVRASAGVSAKIEGSLEVKEVGDGTSYFYVKPEGDARTFSLQDGVASIKEGGSVNFVGHVEAHGGVSLLAAGKAEASAVAKQKLEFNAHGMVTNVQFYVSAEMTVGISVNGEIPLDCQPIEVYKQPTSVLGFAHASAGFSAGISAHGWSNATMRTVTDYVTYCPDATTLTITTCVNEVCNTSDIVVTGETTVTVTDECLVPETSVMGAPTNNAKNSPASNAPAANNAKNSAENKAIDPTSKPAASKNNQTSAPQVSSFNGAARNVAGVAGIAGLIAFLI